MKFPEGAAAMISAMDRLADPRIDCVLLAVTNEVVGLAAFAGVAAKTRGVRIVATNSRGMIFHCRSRLLRHPPDKSNFGERNPCLLGTGPIANSIKHPV